MKVYSFILTHDSGFAPNPFYGVCTLACCKPSIRRAAQVGDLIVGLSSRAQRIVFAMQVTRMMDFYDYWNDPRFASKRPDMRSPRRIDRRGDNIYQPIRPGAFRQLPSRHSNRDGTERSEFKSRDLGGSNVLISERFAYFGREGPPLPPELAFLKVGRGHRSRFTPDQVDKVARWFQGLPNGILGRPALWPEDDPSWRQR